MRVSVIGAGSWGTTIAAMLAIKGVDTTLWAYEDWLAKEMPEVRENKTYLPGVKLPESLKITNSLNDALLGAGMVVCVVPTQAIRSVFKDAKGLIGPDAVVINASKGLEAKTFLTCRSVLLETLGKEFGDRLGVLSGPTFAKELSKGLPAAACVAAPSLDAAEAAQDVFSTKYFRVYTNTDPVGVELGGTLKNVMAIASGISDGLGLGFNSRSALITRALAEMTRLGVKLGAKAETFYGLSGMGDLVLTCTGPLSRNYTVGFEIGQGKTLKELMEGRKTVAEGVMTAASVVELSRRSNIEMPIAEEVCKVLNEGKSPRDAVMALMTRELKGE